MYHGSEGALRYLFGDSTESELEFDYLAFLREVIDCAVVMAECEVTLGFTVEDRRMRELETAAVVAAVEELGRRAAQVVGPPGSDQASTPVGRCAAAIATAIREAVDRESLQARAALAAECEEMDRQDERQRGRARNVLEKLLRVHDLPGADKSLEVVWSATGARATLCQRTSFAVEAVLLLEIPVGSVLGVDLRVDKLADGVEIHTHETAGWLKKSDKVVPHKLGRYQVASVRVGSEATTVRLRSGPEANAVGFVVTSGRNGDLSVEPSGGGSGREVAIDDRARPGLRLLVERLETAVRALADNRSGLVSIEIDGTPIAQHGHPRVFAERLIAVIAPTVHQIAQRSRSPGELVLRRLLGDNRREEIFVSTADLLKRLDGLPLHAREVFAPLQLGGEPAKAPLDEPKLPARPAVEVKPAPAPAPPVATATERTGSAIDRKFDTEPETRPETRPDARPPRTVPPPAPMSDGRSRPDRLPSLPAAADARRTRPTAPREQPPDVDMPIFDDQTPPFSRADTGRTAAKLHVTVDAGTATAPRVIDKPPEIADTSRARADDSLSAAIDRALDDREDSLPK
jgi:hypothetical protein